MKHLKEEDEFVNNDSYLSDTHQPADEGFDYDEDDSDYNDDFEDENYNGDDPDYNGDSEDKNYNEDDSDYGEDSEDENDFDDDDDLEDDNYDDASDNDLLEPSLADIESGDQEKTQQSGNRRVLSYSDFLSKG